MHAAASSGAPSRSGTGRDREAALAMREKRSAIVLVGRGHRREQGGGASTCRSCSLEAENQQPSRARNYGFAKMLVTVEPRRGTRRIASVSRPKPPRRRCNDAMLVTATRPCGRPSRVAGLRLRPDPEVGPRAVRQRAMHHLARERRRLIATTTSSKAGQRVDPPSCSRSAPSGRAQRAADTDHVRRRWQQTCPGFDLAVIGSLARARAKEGAAKGTT